MLGLSKVSVPITQVHTFPIDSPQIQGGIETWIADYLLFAREDYLVLGQGKTIGSPERRSGNSTLKAITKGSSMESVPNAFALLFGIIRYRRLFSDVIFLHRIELMVALRALFPKARIALFIHTNLEAQSRFNSGKTWQLRGAWYRVYERLALKLADLVVVHSAPDFERVSSLSKRAILAGAWFNNLAFSGPSVVSRREGIIWVGRLEGVKDPILALRAFGLSATEHSQNLTIIGEGSLRRAVEQEIVRLGLSSRVRLAPVHLQEELAEVLSHSKLLLHTSYFEGAPRILVEAAAQGVPLVTCQESDPEGISALLGLGLQAKVRSAKAFSDAIVEALSEFEHGSDGSGVGDRAGSRFVPRLEKEILTRLFEPKDRLSKERITEIESHE